MKIYIVIAILFVQPMGVIPSVFAVNLSELQRPYPFLRPVAHNTWDTGDFLRSMHSVGQLVRLEQSVIVGEVMTKRIDPNYERTREIEKEFWLQPAIWLEVDVKDVIWGDESLQGKKLEIAVPWRFVSPEEGFSGWMFLSQKVLRRSKALSFSEAHIEEVPVEGSRGYNIPYAPFLRTNVVELDYWVLLGGVLGAFDENDEKMDCVKEYAQVSHRWYRDREGTAKEMADMLTKMAASSHERLRKDADIDSRRLYRFLSTEEHASLLEEDVSDWFRERFARLEEHFNPPIRPRKEVEEKVKAEGFYENITSDDKERLNEALTFLRREVGLREIREYRDMFLSYIRALLDHPDPDVRYRAAEILGGRIRDVKAVPVLLEAFREQSRQKHRFPRSLKALHRATSKAFPYDYDASQEKRDAQIRVWEEWWEREGHELLQKEK